MKVSVKKGPVKVKAPKTRASFVLGSRPSTLRAPTPKPDTRQYGKLQPSAGFGNLGVEPTEQ